MLQVDLIGGVDLGVLIWLALALTGTALIVGGIILFLGKKRVSVRAIAGAAVAVGVVMWAALLFTLPVSTTVENHPDPIAAEVLDHSNLPNPPESRIRSSSGNQGNREGHLMQILDTDLNQDQLLSHYRQQIQQAGWELSPTMKDDNLSVLTWTSLDESNQLIRRIFIIMPAGQDRWLVSETYVLISP